MDAELQEKQMADLKKLGEMIKNGCDNAIKEHETKKDSKEDDEPGKYKYYFINTNLKKKFVGA